MGNHINGTNVKALLVFIGTLIIGWLAFVSQQAISKPDIADVHAAIKAEVNYPYIEDRKLINQSIVDARAERLEIKRAIETLRREIQSIEKLVTRQHLP